MSRRRNRGVLWIGHLGLWLAAAVALPAQAGKPAPAASPKTARPPAAFPWSWKSDDAAEPDGNIRQPLDARPGGGTGSTNRPATAPFQWSWQAPIPTGPADGEPAAGEYESLVRENLELRAELGRVTGQFHGLKQDNAALQLQVRDLEQKRAGLAAALQEMRTPDEVAAELQRLRAANREREERAARLSVNLQETATNASLPTIFLPPGSGLFKQLEKENMELRTQVAALTGTAGQSAAAVQKLEQQAGEQATALEALRKENLQLREKIAEKSATSKVQGARPESATNAPPH